MPKYVYDSLNLSKDAIRLLRLAKGCYSDPIRCELFETLPSRVKGTPYEALSHTWGSTTTPVDISLGSRTAYITTNMNMALHHLRLPDQDRILWVDAVCIDQSNHRERGHQVGQMRLIYEYAEQVLIWLGPSNKDIDFLFESMNRLDTRMMQVDKSCRNSLDIWHAEWNRIQKQYDSNFNNQRLKTLDGLLKRSWFRRIWILQEVASAKSARIISGWSSTPTRTFSMMPLLMKLELADSIQAVMEIMPGPLRAGSQSWWSQRPDLFALLERFGRNEATDRRDNIYALLGIASDTRGNASLLPDYGLELRMVLWLTTTFLIFGRVLNLLPISSVPKWDVDDFLASLDGLHSQILTQLHGHAFHQIMVELLTGGFHQRCLDAISALFPRLCFDLGAAEVVRAILHSRKFDMNAKHDRDTRPCAAAHEGCTPVVHLLLRRIKLEVNGPGSGGKDLLEAALVMSRYGIVDLLLGREDNQVNGDHHKSSSPLSLASRRGISRLITSLLKKEASLKSEDGARGRSPMWIAAQENHEDGAKLLLEDGAQIETYDSLKYTSNLCTSTSTRSPGTASLFVQYGADVEVSSNGILNPPLYAAIDHDDAAVVRQLLQSEPDLNPQRIVPRMQTPLSYAIENGSAKAVKVLIENGADFCHRTVHDSLLTIRMWGNQNKNIIAVLQDFGVNTL